MTHGFLYAQQRNSLEPEWFKRVSFGIGYVFPYFRQIDDQFDSRFLFAVGNGYFKRAVMGRVRPKKIHPASEQLNEAPGSNPDFYSFSFPN